MDAASAPPNVGGPTTLPERLMTMKTLNPMNDPAVRSTTAPMTRRPRRLRRSEGIRSLVRETVVHAEDLIYPLFVVPSSRPRVEIGSMPGVFQMRVREAVDERSEEHTSELQ